MLKALWNDFVALIQDMWHAWPDDPLMTGFNRFVAMLIVACAIIALSMLAVLVAGAVCNPILLVYIAVPAFIVFAATYGIAHLKTDKDNKQ